MRSRLRASRSERRDPPALPDCSAPSPPATSLPPRMLRLVMPLLVGFLTGLSGATIAVVQRAKHAVVAPELSR